MAKTKIVDLASSLLPFSLFRAAKEAETGSKTLVFQGLPFMRT